MVKQDFEEWFLSSWIGFHQLGDTQMQSPTHFGRSEQFLGGWHSSASAKRIKCSGVLGVVAHY